MTATLPPALHVACGPAIRTIFVRETTAGNELRGLFIARSGRFALVSWGRTESGGMSVLEKRGSVWCRTANGGGAFGERDLVGFDGIDAATAHALFARLREANAERVR